MSEFANTVDLLGDDVVLASIVNKTITEFKDDKVTFVGPYAFNYCKDLETVDIPNATYIARFGFNQSKLTSLNAPKVTRVFAQGLSSANLTELCLPELTFATTQAFSSNNFVSVKLPKYTGKGRVKEPMTDNSERNNGDKIFAYCRQLKRVDFPALEYMYVDMFYGCNSLTEIILRNTKIVSTYNNSILLGTPFADGNGHIYVPKSLLSDDDETKDYRRATNWTIYANQFRALEDYTVDGTVTGELDESKI